MKILTDPQKLQRLCGAWRKRGKKIILVPTMGFYHAGHVSLMRHARKSGGKVVVSLFVNPTQFGPDEDLAAYPRNSERDAAIAKKNGVDVLFMPEPQAMFPPGYATWVEVPELSREMCGKSRPGHFRGVCTVVTKLLMLTQPTKALFGRKDWQQAAIIRRMAADLNIPVRIVTRPTVREKDGLAMSSRNVYLTAEERGAAPHLYASLCLASDLARSGEKRSAALLQTIREYWRRNLPQAQEDYLVIVDPETLEPLETIGEAALCALAVRLGKARLIDNMLFHS